MRIKWGKLMSRLSKLVLKEMAKRDAKLRKKPHFSKNYRLSYITGFSALNIPYKGIQCDWHQVDTLKGAKETGFVMHPTTIIGAETVFGDYGLWDCGAWLRERGFEGEWLCATPIRAILDLLFWDIEVLERYPASLDFRDLMCEEVDTVELFSKLDIFAAGSSENGGDLLKRWRKDNGLRF